MNLKMKQCNKIVSAGVGQKRTVYGAGHGGAPPQSQLFRRLKQENLKFKANLGNIMRAPPPSQKQRGVCIMLVRNGAVNQEFCLG
jgi:hypothetical protein